MTKLNSLSIVEAKKALLSKDFSVKELVQAPLDAMHAQQDLNMYVLETAELALANAEISQKKINRINATKLERYHPTSDCAFNVFRIRMLM